MSNLQFDKYKPYLRQIIEHFNYRSDINPAQCINPEHENSNTPAMLLYDEHFNCQSCGVKGDIYDAVGLLSGIHEKVEQYKKVEEILGKSDFTEYKKKSKNEFTPNETALKKILEYIILQRKSHEKEVLEYLKNRNSTEDMIKTMSKYLGYWPGYSQAEKDLGKDILWKSGIPGKNPTTGLYSWGPSGPVVKLGLGFKLFFYDGNESKKIGSKKCKIFPAFIKGDSDKLYLTEGEMSALAMISAGFEDVSPTGGVKGLSKNNMESLLPYSKIYIVFDGDTAGRKSVHELKNSMREFGVDADIYIVRLPKGKDPDDLIKAGKLNIITDAIMKAEKASDEIKQAVGNAESKQKDNYNTPFYFAGYDEKNYYVVPRNQSIPISIGRADGSIKGMMFDIAPSEFWYERFIKETKEGKMVFDMNSAIKWFREKGQKTNLYDHNRALGIGPHMDDNKIIFNTGDGLYLFDEKKKINYSEYEGSKFYVRSTDNYILEGEAWDLVECRRLYKEIRKYGFNHTVDFMLIAGWVVLAPFASILKRRPHLAIIGQKGSGKTTLIENIVQPAVGEIGLYVEGETTEAGIRQYIGRDCKPTIIDEFEANTMEKRKRVEGVLSLARSSFGGEARTIKGTQNQKALVFNTKVMFMFLAIKIDLLNDANRSRIPILSSKNLNNKLDDNFDFTGLRRRTFENLDKILELTNITRKYMEKYDYDNRTLDTYSTLLAGFWFLVSDSDFLKDPSEKLNDSMLEVMKNISHKDDNSDSDEIMILNYIFNHRIRIAPDKELTIFEMLNITDVDGESFTYRDQLSRWGIRRDIEMTIEGESYNALAIVGHHADIQTILRDTEYYDYKDMLGRHPAHIFEETKPIYIVAQKQKQRCIILDWDKIKEHHFIIEKDETELPF